MELTLQQWTQAFNEGLAAGGKMPQPAPQPKGKK